MKKNNIGEKVVIPDLNSKDKPSCFAWISKSKCNALNTKECKNCRFYKHYSELPNYSKIIFKSI